MTATPSELSRPIALEPWPEPGRALQVVAGAGERRALASRFGLVALDALAADLVLERSAGGKTVIVRGAITATVVQTCVVSLEDIRREVSAAFERCFGIAAGPAGSALAEPLVDPDAIDVEPLEGTVLDLGAVVAEELGLALDDYPHAADAYAEIGDLGANVTFEVDAAPSTPPTPPTAQPGAFAALASLRDRLTS